MDFEQYTVILKHEIVYGTEKIEVEQPLILTQAFDRRYIGAPILIDKLMDDFKKEILRRMSDK